MVLHTNAHNYEQRVAIILNPIERTESPVEYFFFQYIIMMCVNPMDLATI